MVAATLRRSAVHDWISTLLDVFLSLVPLFFLDTYDARLGGQQANWIEVITILCLSLNGKPISPYGQDIKAITLLSPTIFPIVYAAVLGKLLRRIALFKAERISSVGISNPQRFSV